MQCSHTEPKENLLSNSYLDLKQETVGLCVSGGLDSKTLALKLKQLGINVVCFAADLAQPDEKDINDIERKMAPCGVETVIVDLKKEMAEICTEAIKAQAQYDGGYWNSTGLARAVTVRGLLPVMQERGCTVLAHGATGRGNDQIRFERYVNVLAPGMKVYAPWRDAQLLNEFPGRTQMAQFLKEAGFPTFEEQKKRYSTDANLAGLSHEAEDLEDLETPSSIVEATMGAWPDAAPDQTEEFWVEFEAGLPKVINGESVTPLQALTMANEIGGRNGIGIKDALENRIIGTKSRGVYEAPGMELLGSCVKHVYQAILDRRAGQLFRQLSRLIADQIYDGRYFDPATCAARSAIDILASKATGKVTVGLYKGNVIFHSLTNCPGSIYNMEDSSMEASSGLNPVSSQGFVEIQSVEALSLARAGQIDNF